MAYGPRVCAACGSQDGIEEHHLVPRSRGGEALPTVYLCGACHRISVHGLRETYDHAALTRLGLDRARSRGVQLGNPRLRSGTAELSRVANAVRTKIAVERAQ